MAQRHTSNPKEAIFDLNGDDASVESIWREAMLLRQFDRDDVSTARARRSEAEAARRDAEKEALTATHELCEDLRGRARADLQKAQDALAESERLKADAAAEAARKKSDADAELERARAIRGDAEAYAARIESTAKEKAEATIAEARAEAARIKETMKDEAADDIRRLIGEVELARAAAQEELETQRILTETARIRAFSPGLAAREIADGAAMLDQPSAQGAQDGDALDQPPAEKAQPGDVLDRLSTNGARNDEIREPIVLEASDKAAAVAKVSRPVAAKKRRRAPKAKMSAS